IRGRAFRARHAHHHLLRETAEEAEGDPMSAVAPVELPLDTATQKQLGRRESVAKRTKKRLTSRWATLAALVIAVLWTLPTFGLLVSSLRPAALVNTTGWWTIFEIWGFTLDNYVDVLSSGNGTLDLAGSF